MARWHKVVCSQPALRRGTPARGPEPASPASTTACKRSYTLPALASGTSSLVSSPSDRPLLGSRVTPRLDAIRIARRCNSSLHFLGGGNSYPPVRCELHQTWGEI